MAEKLDKLTDEELQKLHHKVQVECDKARAALRAIAAEIENRADVKAIAELIEGMTPAKRELFLNRLGSNN